VWGFTTRAAADGCQLVLGGRAAINRICSASRMGTVRFIKTGKVENGEQAQGIHSVHYTTSALPVFHRPPQIKNARRRCRSDGGEHPTTPLAKLLGALGCTAGRRHGPAAAWATTVDCYPIPISSHRELPLWAVSGCLPHTFLSARGAAHSHPFWPWSSRPVTSSCLPNGLRPNK
jgi:hypothetical protein